MYPHLIAISPLDFHVIAISPLDPHNCCFTTNFLSNWWHYSLTAHVISCIGELLFLHLQTSLDFFSLSSNIVVLSITSKIYLVLHGCVKIKMYQNQRQPFMYISVLSVCFSAVSHFMCEMWQFLLNQSHRCIIMLVLIVMISIE